MKMFDTHCHLNFKALRKNIPEIISQAKQAGVTQITIPGTDVPTSQRAVELASEHEHIYAAVGIHPHHVFQYLTVEANSKSTSAELVAHDLKEIEALLSHKKVVAVGEVGLDKHVYENTKYAQYVINEKFLTLQKELLTQLIKLAITHNKSLILHNREAVDDLLPLLQSHWQESLARRTVFHCCEPLEEILEFAKKKQIYIGVDGDITYDTKKQEFIQKIPVELLVLETDSPYLLPEPLKSEKKYPNVPANLKITAEYIAELLKIDTQELISKTTINAQRLFGLKHSSS